MEERIIEVKEKEIVKEEKPSIDVGDMGKLKKRDSKAKSHYTFLQGLKSTLSKEGNTNALILVSEIEKDFLKHYPSHESYIEIIEGWEKSNGVYPIWKDFNNNFMVKIWHGENFENMKVEKDDMNNMLRVIRRLEKGKEYKCYDIAEMLGHEWKEIWKERTELYFKIYYPCLKIFNELGIIRYGGNKKSIVRMV